MTVSQPADTHGIVDTLAKSGSCYCQAGTEKTVEFDEDFSSQPDIVLTPWGNCNLWLTSVWKGQFTFQNNSSEQVQVHWFAFNNEV